ncbi:hypothetical protein KY284_032558 [Solanum tuberosum]|nr:hypothetical protein KY284_032558 [Solanum tuberosum]
MPGEKHSPGVSVKALKGEHKCDDPCGNYKEKLQANPKYKIKEMRFDFKIAFIINAHFEKCKRAKRIILENIEGSCCDDYKKLVGYANALKASNAGSDIVLKVSRDALSDGKRKFLRMYICFEAMKNGFKSGLRPFICLDGLMNHFYLITWAIVDKECKKSLNINNGEGTTFISDMQTILCETHRGQLEKNG